MMAIPLRERRLRNTASALWRIVRIGKRAIGKRLDGHMGRSIADKLKLERLTMANGQARWSRPPSIEQARNNYSSSPIIYLTAYYHGNILQP